MIILISPNDGQHLLFSSFFNSRTNGYEWVSWGFAWISQVMSDVFLWAK
jgi:hypothetical protein